MKLVDDWKSFPRWFSVQIVAIGSAAPAGWLLIPEDVRAAMPEHWLAIGGAAFFAVWMVGRLVEQKR